MTQLIRARLPNSTVERIKQYAHQKQNTVDATVAMALEEWLRQNELAYIEFRETPHGRMVYMKNSRLPVCWVIHTAKSYDMDVEKTQAHWPNRPRAWIQAAFHYYEAYPEEIDGQITLHQFNSSFEELKRRLPQMEAVIVPTDVPG